MADCEDQLELSRNLYDELFSQTEQLRVEKGQLVDALRQVADGRTTLEAQRIAIEVLQRFGIPLLDD